MTKPYTKSEVIDVHSHIYPEIYINHLESRNEVPCVINRDGQRLFSIFQSESIDGKITGRPMPPSFWDLEAKLAYMDTNQIDCSVVSLGNPWVNPMADSEGDALVRAVNTEMAGYQDQTGGRIVAIGALASSSVDAAIRELLFIANMKSLVGIGVGPKICNLHFDDPLLDPFWAMLELQDLPLYIHPENGVAINELQGYGHALPIGVAFPMETTVSVSRLVFGGVLERYPGLRIIVAHGGGVIPFLTGRLDVVWRTDIGIHERLPKPPSNYLKSMFYDGLVYSGLALQAVCRLAGIDHVMFGTDHPFSVADPQVNYDAISDEFE